MNFSREELINMIFVLGESNKNVLLAKRLYHQEFPDRQPRTEAFEILLERFGRTGSMNNEKSNRTNTVLTDENEFDVLLSITENSHISTREMSRDLDISDRIPPALRIEESNVESFDENPVTEDTNDMPSVTNQSSDIVELDGVSNMKLTTYQQAIDMVKQLKNSVKIEEMQPY
ncbi:hypothetical protein MML48_3g00001016 [Holotrichia oblita]|uniref:Uncharacterized protein n=1 Tax=Holotrichia oblita TaxID=644536 RepID=A0ACB9THH7_HOLOL|nr:hypothetical protein MML48_3g00001016 [Holotrichia oblita]